MEGRFLFEAMYDFQYGTKFLIKDTEYIVKRVMENEIKVENLSYKRTEDLSIDDLLDQWSNNELIFRFKGDETDKKLFNESFSLLPEDKKNKARRRFKILEPVIQGEILPNEVDNYLENLNVGRSQFYVWKKKWDTFQDIRILVPNKPGPKGPRNEVVHNFIKDIVNERCYKGEKFTYVQLYQDLLKNIVDYNELRLPEDKISPITKRALERKVKDIIDQNRVEEQRQGPVQTKLHKNGSTKEVYVTRPLQRVEIDWTTVDVMLINPRTGKPDRPTLIYSIDKCTGHPLGFYITFNPVDAAALKQCLLHTIMPKRYLRTLYPDVENDWITYGTPEEIVLDNASVNDSLDFEDACLQLGINIHFVGVGAGNQKGTIERAFRELNTKFIHSLKGTTFSNTIEKGQYDSEGKACISLNAFIYMIHIALVDIVAQEFDRKRLGSPAKLWNDALKKNPHLSFPLTQTNEQLKLALMSGIEIRTITNKGVAIQNEYFQSSELMKLKNMLTDKYGHSKNVRVRFDLADMRTVFVWDEFEKVYIRAQQTGLERRGYDEKCPIHYSDMALDSFLSRHPNYMDEAINKERAMTKIFNIQEEEDKNHKKGKAQQNQSAVDNNTEEERAIAGIPNTEILNDHFEGITAVESKESRQEVTAKDKAGTKKNKPQTTIASYDVAVDELPSFGAFIRTN